MASRILRGLGVLLLAAGLIFLFRPPATPADGRVHITYWEKWTGFEGDACRAMVDAYNARQDRVWVDLLAISRVDQKMLLATAGGNPPDVAGLWDFNVDVFAGYNALTRLDDLCKQAGFDESYYLPAYWQLCLVKGHVYALPTTPATAALHWNKQHFREVGLDPEKPPRTLEELDAMAEKLTVKAADGRYERMGFMPSEPGWWNWGWGYFFGGKLWNGKDRITANTPENVRAFEWVKSYADRYGAQDLQLFQSGFGNFSSPQNAFIAGKVSMELQGVWMYNFINKYNPDLEWGAAPFPYPADRPDLANSTPVGLDVLVIPAGAKHPREAWDFVKFVESQEGMEMLCLGQRKHSPLAHVSDDFYRKHPNPYIKLFYNLAKSHNTFRQPKTTVWKAYQDEMKNAFDRIWTEGWAPRDALANVDRRMQVILDRELARERRRAG